MPMRRELIDELLKDYQDPQAILAEDGLLKQLTKAVIERCLETELDTHLGYPTQARQGNPTGNRRKGQSPKTRPRRAGPGRHRRAARPARQRSARSWSQRAKRGWTAQIEKIVALSARGMPTRAIQAQRHELSGVEVSPLLISNVTQAVMDEVRQWQARPLEAVDPIVSLDCLVVKVREHQQVVNKSVYVALGGNLSGYKERLGMWIAQSEGAKFWLAVLSELQNRGVKDRFMACVDGLTGFPEAIEAVYPQTRVQLCLVHLVRNSAQRRVLQADERGGHGSQSHLFRKHRGRSRAEFGALCRAMGCALVAASARLGAPTGRV